MGFIKLQEPDGRVVQHEAPSKAVAYLKPSGKTELNKLDVAMGVKEPRKEFVSDQRWIFDLGEAAELEKKEPNRLVKLE